MNEKRKFKVAVEFKVVIEPITAPDLGECLDQQENASVKHADFQAWIDAQQRLQQEIMSDAMLRTRFLRQALRQLTIGQVDKILNKVYGEAVVDPVLTEAFARLSNTDQETLSFADAGRLLDEIELLDATVSCRFAGLEVTEI